MGEAVDKVIRLSGFVPFKKKDDGDGSDAEGAGESDYDKAVAALTPRQKAVYDAQLKAGKSTEEALAAAQKIKG